MDHEYSYVRNSYVTLKNGTEQCVMVGQISSLFYHKHQSSQTVFAIVSWFDRSYAVSHSKLNYALLHPVPSLKQSVVPVSNLSKPLVVAQDDEDSAKLWFLNLLT